MASTYHRTRMLWLLFLLPVCSGASVPDTFTVSVPDGPLSVWKGSSIVLPCSLSPAFTESLEVRWHRPTEFKTPVLLYQKQQIQQQPADPQYKDRVRLVGELQKGNLSLEMDNVQLADSGDYVCYVSAKTTYEQARIHLVVKAMGTPPIISDSDGGSGQVNITCESEGWSPQPTLTWRNRGGAEIPSVSYHSATDAHGLMSVTSWLLHSSSEWIACSVGLSEDERKESRFLPGTVNELHKTLAQMESLKQKSEGRWKDGLIALFSLLFLIAVIALAVVLYRNGLGISKDQNVKDSEGAGMPLTANNQDESKEVETLTKVVVSHDTVHCSRDASATLSCQLSPEKSADDMEIRWFKVTGTDYHCISRYQNRQMKEGEGYEGRVSLRKEELENGKIILELSNTQPEDKGKYVCQVTYRKDTECALEIRHALYAKDKNQEFCIYPCQVEFTVENKSDMEASAQKLGSTSTRMQLQSVNLISHAEDLAYC